MVNTFLENVSMSGAIVTIDFDNFLSSKRIMKYVYQKKIDLTYLTGDFYWRFLHTKNTQEGQAFMISRNRFP